jgi:hypothetical protein
MASMVSSVRKRRPVITRDPRASSACVATMMLMTPMLNAARTNPALTNFGCEVAHPSVRLIGRNLSPAEQRRLPRLKGEARGRHTVARPMLYAAVNLGQLGDLSSDTIGPEDLRAAGLVRKKAELVKILGDGEIGRAIVVRAHAFSKSAKEKIEAAGGNAEVLER